MDRVGANFTTSVESIRNRLGANPVLLQLPLGSENEHRGVIDLVEMKALVFDEDSKGAEFETIDIPEDYLEGALEAREKLLETAAENDDGLMERYLEGDTDFSATDIISALRVATLDFKLVPVCCGSALKNKGVQRLLDAIINFLPSPLEVRAIEGVNPKSRKTEVRQSTDDGPFSALAFKILNDPFMGQLSFIRVYSGTARTGDMVLNATKEKKERIGRLLRMHADRREDVKEIYSGNIYAAVGLKTAQTGDTLCDAKKPIVLEQMAFPDPVISVAVEPRTKEDQDRLGDVLEKLSLEDPSFRAAVDEETGQTIISGMGELHLEVIVDRMRREYKVSCNVGKPQVAYREGICETANGEGKFIRETGGHGMYGHVRLEVKPAPRGNGFSFASEAADSEIPREFIPAVEKGIRDAMRRGILAYFPVIDVQATVAGGSFHEVDSSSNAFEVAASMALQDAAERAGLVLLEPVFSLEVVAPEEYMGDVIGDINGRRGRVTGMTRRGNVQVVTAEIPLSTTFGYSTDLRSLTQGRGTHTMQFHQYEAVPQNISKEIITRIKGG
jgi:elongation factor G